MAKRTPSYCLHKASGQAVVRIDGQDHYLGAHGTPESYGEYDRLIAEWLANGRCLPNPADGITVDELLVCYWQWAEQHYRDHEGKVSNELENIRYAVKPLRRLYGHTPAVSFRPLALRAIQTEMIKADLCRGVVNARINKIRRVFKWAASFELIPASIWEALRTVPGLTRGRSEARETNPVRPVPEEHVRAAKRVSKRTPSQLKRKRKARPKRTPAERYNRASYLVAIVRACEKAQVPAWSPLQLRHSAATAIRAKYGVEASRVILGHTRVETSQIYAERDLGAAQRIMQEIG